MLFKTLDHIRTKPEHVRKQYAFVTALVMTILVGGLWAVTLPARFVSKDANVAAAGSAPFSSLWTQLKDQFGQLKEEALSVGELATSTPVVATDYSSSTYDATAILSSSSDQYIAPTPVAIPVLIGTTSSVTVVGQ